MSSSMSSITRRALLQKAASLSLTSATAPLGLSLLGMSNAAAQTATDYKALVCVFLSGGNDHYNTVIPFDETNYESYFMARSGAIDGVYSGIAVNKSALFNELVDMRLNDAALLDVRSMGAAYALHPNLKGVRQLYNSKRAAVLLNIGTLVQPTNKKQYLAKNRLPPQLFSHNDQQAYWQSCIGSEGTPSGWGGRIADMILDRGVNGNATTSGLTCVSITSNALWPVGKSAAKNYQISTAGAQGVNARDTLYGSASAAHTLNHLMRHSARLALMGANIHPMEAEYAAVTSNSLDMYASVNSMLTAGEATMSNLFETHRINRLSAQLKRVAELIQQRNSEMRRQIFFVSLGGFDHHNFLATGHSELLQLVNDALFDFDKAMEAISMNDAVTVFTASDFGRTLASNGDGSDHGWGGHHFVLGGAVNGGRIFGTPSRIGMDNEDAVGGGRALPSMAVDQVARELARWFGVGNKDIEDILPNSKNFESNIEAKLTTDSFETISLMKAAPLL